MEALIVCRCGCHCTLVLWCNGLESWFSLRYHQENQEAIMMMQHTLLLLSRDNSHYQRLLAQKALPNLTLLVADDESQAQQLAPQADLLLGEPALIAKVLPLARQLQWAQSTYAGVDALLHPGLRQDYQLTNIRGVFGPLMSEYVFAHLLSLTRHLPIYREQQKNRHWQALPYRPLSERRMLILGTGSIGQYLAATAHQFGMEVWGVNRQGREVAGFDDIFQSTALKHLLPQVDVIVSALPSTPETHHLFSRELLACCQPSAILFNVGRGDAIHTQDLIEALRAGRPGAAILDVFEEEPLPAQDPLWQLPNLIITPHNSAWSLPEQVANIFERNYLRFLDGSALEFMIDFQRGY
jgi:phosphoglycerate dehydrogenase-like enzyme